MDNFIPMWIGKMVYLGFPTSGIRAGFRLNRVGVEQNGMKSGVLLIGGASCKVCART